MNNNATPSTPPPSAPQSTSFFTSKPFIALVATAVVLCGGIALFKSLAEKTTLSFDFSLDGKTLPDGGRLDVKLDGQPFTSGSKIGAGRHQITVRLENAEPLEHHFWILSGAKDLGTLPLESSKGSLAVAVTPSPANVVVRRGGETVRQGEAPLSIEKLPIGDYTLVVRRGEYEETQSATVRRQQLTEAKIDLKLGSADLSSEPADAEFELSGGGRHWQGKLPTRLDDVPVGSYSFVARRRGWELTADVPVSRDNVASNRIAFRYGSINVTSDPTGLVVSTNGVEAGKTPIELRELRPGSYEVAATDGENALTATVVVGPKEDVNKQFLFRYSAVQLASTPPGAAVLRNGKEIGKTPLTLARLPAGESRVELQFDGYAPTNFTIVGMEGVTTNYNVKLISEHYLQAMRQAHQAFEASQLTESQKFLTTALEAEPNDAAALALQKDVFTATLKAEESRKEAERKAQEAEQAAKEAARKEQAEANARAVASMAWLDFQKVIYDCTDTRQVQYPVVMENGRYETYRDENGKYKQRWVKTGQHTEMHTKTESTFNPIKFSQQYQGKSFRFNCPDKWAVSKVEKEGAVVLRAGEGLASDEIRAVPATSNPDAFRSLQKGQRVSFKAVLKKYDKGILVRTLYLEDAELLNQTAAFAAEPLTPEVAPQPKPSIQAKANTSAGDPAQREIVQLLERAIAAMGGSETVTRFRSFKRVSTVNGSIKGKNYTMRVTDYQQLPDKLRVDQSFGGKTQTFYIVGDRAITVAKALGFIPKKITAEGEAELRQGLYIDDCRSITPLFNPAYHLEKLNVYPAGANDVVAIKVSKTSQPDITLLFQKDKALLVGVDWNSERLRFADFQSFSGYTYPTTVRYSNSSDVQNTQRIENLEPLETFPEVPTE